MITLNTLRQSLNRWYLCYLAVFLPLGILAMLLMVSLLGPSDHRKIHWTTAAGWSSAGKAMLYAGAFLIPFGFLLRFVGRKVLCSCPECNKLLYPRAAYKVIAYGKCPVCDARILKSREVDAPT
jgi:hypothetical protein